MLMTPKGNLLRNPGFELGLRFWEVPQTSSDTTELNVSAHACFPHSGLAALLMNAVCGETLAVVYQDVRVSPGNRYELDFAISGACDGPVKFSAEVQWLDDEGEDLGLALAIFVPRVGSAPDGAWVLHTGITEEVPLGARRARVSFASCDSDGVLVDDASFFKSE